MSCGEGITLNQGRMPSPSFADALPANSKCSARVSKCLTDDACHRVPPRGVRSRMASSWAAIRCSLRSGAAALMPATKRISRSSPCCGLARSSKPASMMPSSASRRTVRRSRSTVLAACASGSERGRRRPRAGPDASAARSAATRPTAPRYRRDMRHHDRREPCGWRWRRRPAGPDCRPRGRACAPRATARMPMERWHLQISRILCREYRSNRF